jgi:hypothetical protein
MGPPSYDNGRCFRELFEHPDQWQQTRAAIDTLIYADHCLNKQFTDDQLRTWFPMMKKRGLADDSTWYVSIMRRGYDYALVQGSPDQYVVQSWLDAPSHSVPETEQWSFTRSVLDFSRKFVKRGP